MQYFFCKLVAPRPTFLQDMTENEARVMAEHATYWQHFAKQGSVLAYGPVGDPRGVWGLGILAVDDEAQLQTFLAKDPVTLAGIGTRFETSPMLHLMLGTDRLL